MKARELREYLMSLDGGWVDREQTVDTFKAGDPEADVRGIAVGWMSYAWALKRAVELACNVFVTHEPTYFNHRDDDEAVFRFPAARAKRAFIEGSGLVILRCHDVWDRLPGMGIADSWSAALALGEPVTGEGYFRVFDVAGRTAGDVARHVAERTRPFGQDVVQLVGPPDRAVSRLAVGTGACTPFLDLIERYEADCVVCTDDGFCCWRDAAFAIDAGLSAIVVNHAVSEEPGMIRLANHLRERLGDIPVHHVPQRCMYGFVAAEPQQQRKRQ